MIEYAMDLRNYPHAIEGGASSIHVISDTPPPAVSTSRGTVRNRQHPADVEPGTRRLGSRRRRRRSRDRDSRSAPTPQPGDHDPG